MKTGLYLVLAVGGWLCIGCDTYPGMSGPGPTQELNMVEEIDRSIARSRDDLRMRKLVHVARRPTLDPIVQTYLVHRVYEGLALADNKAQIFMLLIENPAFAQSTRQEILARVDELGENKAQILQALNQTP